MWLECGVGNWEFKVLFSALPLLHSSFDQDNLSFCTPVLPISIERDSEKILVNLLKKKYRI